MCCAGGGGGGGGGDDDVDFDASAAAGSTQALKRAASLRTTTLWPSAHLCAPLLNLPVGHRWPSRMSPRSRLLRVSPAARFRSICRRRREAAGDILDGSGCLAYCHCHCLYHGFRHHHNILRVDADVSRNFTLLCCCKCCSSRYCAAANAVLHVTVLLQMLFFTLLCCCKCCSSSYCAAANAVLHVTVLLQMLFFALLCCCKCCSSRYCAAANAVLHVIVLLQMLQCCSLRVSSPNREEKEALAQAFVDELCEH